MKSWNNLFQQVIDRNNIIVAMHDAQGDKGAFRSIETSIDDRYAYADRLIAQLENGTWEPPKHVPVQINDGIKQKKRIIIKPTYNEQVVHHAIIQVMEPVFMHGMYEYSCGSIPKRGAKCGKKYLERYLRNHGNECRYCLKMDVRHFFQSVNHTTLISMLSRIIKDERMMDLLALIIRRECVNGVGIPIGFYTSQWFSNFFLQGLDHYVKEQLHAKCYVRYMDDMVIFGTSKRELHRIRRSIEAYLNSIGLEMKNNWQVFRFDYIDRFGNRRGRFLDFMGFRFYRDHITLRRSIYTRAMRKATNISRMNRINWYVASQMLAYLGYLSQVNAYGAFVRYVKPLINVRSLKRCVSRHSKKEVQRWILLQQNALGISPVQ